MSDTFDDFFGQGEFIPTGKFTNATGPGGNTEVGGKIVGEVLSLQKQDQKNLKGETIPDGKGGVKQEVKIVLQTEYRNWEKVAVVPKGENDQPLPPSEDDGRRAIYVRGWMIGAVGDAVREATGKSGAPAIGSKLGVKITELVESTTPGNNPFPKYKAVYTPPATSKDDGFFDEPAAPAQATTSVSTSATVTADEPPF